MNTKRSLISALAVLFAVACGRPAEPPPGEEAASKLPRELSAAPADDVTKATADGADFAFDLYRKLITGDDNLFFSPHSISLALSMTYAGSANATTKAFETTLHQSLAQAKYHRAMNDLDRQLASRGAGAKAADGKAFRLTIANQVFAQTGFGFETKYLDLLAVEYGSAVRLMDFKAQAEPSRAKINAWVEDRTESRIKNLLPEGTITGDTRAVLVNAIYFNAAWKKAFEKDATQPGPFHLANGTTTQVDLMHAPELRTRAASLDSLEVVELAYDGDEMSALMLMPTAGQLSTLEASLSAATLKTYVDALRSESLDLAMPAFEMRTSKSLNAPLQELGLAIAFSGDADFTNMSREAALSVSDVVHQAFVKVNESGTEAAAATGVVVGTTSIPVTRPVTLDRPFIFLVRDNATGAVVFVGRVMQP